VTHRTQCRPRRLLEEFSRIYPSAWKQIDNFRAAKGAGLPDWPDWCFMPLHGAYAIVSGGGDNRVPLDRANHVGILAAFAAWRVTQGIYRFDAELYSSLVETPITAIPTDVLYRLPEWCVYIETPGWAIFGYTLHGFWAHLDWDRNTGNELRLVLDSEDRLITLPLMLEGGTLEESIRMVADHGQAVATRQGIAIPTDPADPTATARSVSGLVSLVLYLCSETPDLGGKTPTRPAGNKTKRGVRFFQAAKPRQWEVGVRLGAAIRKGKEQDERDDAAPGEGHGERVRPHIRRAHWHSFWRGPKKDPGQRKIVLKWLPPIPVNVEDGTELPAVVHKVKGEK
jgi:hypothetical protein